MERVGELYDRAVQTGSPSRSTALDAVQLQLVNAPRAASSAAAASDSARVWRQPSSETKAWRRRTSPRRSDTIVPGAGRRIREATSWRSQRRGSGLPRRRVARPRYSPARPSQAPPVQAARGPPRSVEVFVEIQAPHARRTLKRPASSRSGGRGRVRCAACPSVGQRGELAAAMRSTAIQCSGSRARAGPIELVSPCPPHAPRAVGTLVAPSRAGQGVPARRRRGSPSIASARHGARQRAAELVEAPPGRRRSRP